MINRYEGEIHINPVRVLRNDDYNNDGSIRDIRETLQQVIELNQQVNARLKNLIDWVSKEGQLITLQGEYTTGGYIRINGLTDVQLLMLAKRGWIEIFDNATSREWVKKYGLLFGLVWEGGKAVEI